jgi:hypothetical protein
VWRLRRPRSLEDSLQRLILFEAVAGAVALAGGLAAAVAAAGDRRRSGATGNFVHVIVADEGNERRAASLADHLDGTIRMPDVEIAPLPVRNRGPRQARRVPDSPAPR